MLVDNRTLPPMKKAAVMRSAERPSPAPADEPEADGRDGARDGRPAPAALVLSGFSSRAPR